MNIAEPILKELQAQADGFIHQIKAERMPRVQAIIEHMSHFAALAVANPSNAERYKTDIAHGMSALASEAAITQIQAGKQFEAALLNVLSKSVSALFAAV